jgi:predicted nuclease of predicted toxin-antitoxin system
LKFLLDQDVYAVTARFLVALGHDVTGAVEVGLSRASDEAILGEAQSRGRLLVTRDRDFGTLVFARGMGRGVLYLRILPSTQNSVHNELARILSRYSEEELSKAFVVVEPGGHRFRRLTVSS